MILLQQMVIFAIIMGIGYFLSRKDILDDVTTKKMSWLVANVANPAMILSGAANREGVVSKDVIFVLLFSFCLYFVLMVVAKGIVAVLCKKEHAGMYKVLLVFSNMGFMGLPLASELYGGKAIVYLSIFLIPFNVLMYTYGVSCYVTKEEQSQGNTLKKIINPGTVAGVITLLLCVFAVPVPGLFAQLFDMVGSLTGPLCMMLIGASFKTINIKEMLQDVRLLVYTAMKLILLPLAVMLVLKLMLHDIMLLRVCFIVMATPAASLSVILAKQYDMDDSIAAKAVALTTLCSVLTMPLLLQLLNL